MMIFKIGIAIAVVSAAILVFAATKPSTFRVQRSIEIQAPPEKIFALIDDFHTGRSGLRKTEKINRCNENIPVQRVA